MPNLDAYYTQQAGTGIAFYPGIRYQRGHGFFGRFFRGSLLPLLQSLGHRLLSTGVAVADDVVNNNLDPMASLKSRGKAAVKDTANDFISSARKKIMDMKQTGGGKRKRKSIKAASSKKRVITKSAFAKKTSKKSPSMKKKKSRKSKRAPPKRKSKRSTKKRTSSTKKSKRVPKSVPEFLKI